MATTENLYVGDGSTVLYSFTFPYIEEADVRVSLDQLNTTAFTLANATTVEFTTAPATGVSIRIYRSTPTDTISSVFFPGSAIRAQDLNDNFEQALYVVQESQTIIENSDAASVVGIANQALSTANQASATANAVSGTANTALTTANSADTTATQALADATAANSAAVAARVVADAALDPGSVIGDLSNVSSVAPASNQVLAWSGSQWSPVNQTGGGGGGTTINYSGAAAWGNFESGGTLRAGLNIASVTRVSTGRYDVVFTTPMPNDFYAVTVGGRGSGTRVSSQSATEFRVEAYNTSNNLADLEVGFAVHATNALPPRGGTGADAWSLVGSSGTIFNSFNIATVTKISDGGRYQYTFTTPMPDANYAALVTSNSSSSEKASAYVYNKTAVGFAVQVFVGTAGQNAAHAVVVHATNAQLPDTVTQEQIETAVNNPGCSAWGNVAADGTLNRGLNITSVTRTALGVFDVVFTTPMPDANYSVTTSAGSSSVARFENLTTTGFTIQTRAVATNGAIDTEFCLAVFATNALPPRGGTGTDAWVSFLQDGTISASFNIASVTRNGTGKFDVVFTTPMPTGSYGIVATPNGGNRTANITGNTTTGFQVQIRSTSDQSFIDAGASVTVNATNATLPTTFTAAQIQSVLDFIAVANPAGVAKAWGRLEGDGTLTGGFNVSSVTRSGDGTYAVLFTTPMPNANYAVTSTNNSNNTRYVRVSNITSTGFNLISTNASSGNASDGGCGFAVHSN